MLRLAAQNATIQVSSSVHMIGYAWASHAYLLLILASSVCWRSSTLWSTTWVFFHCTAWIPGGFILNWPTVGLVCTPFSIWWVLQRRDRQAAKVQGKHLPVEHLRWREGHLALHTPWLVLRHCMEWYLLARISAKRLIRPISAANVGIAAHKVLLMCNHRLRH